MTTVWLEILKARTEARGQAQTARELGVSRSTVSLVLRGKYPGGTGNIAKKVLNIYGGAGCVSCPVLGEISPAECAENHGQAKSMGTAAGNPATLRLRLACLDCEVRR